MVDEDELPTVESPGRARSINGKGPYRFGGIPDDLKEPNLALKNFVC